MPPSEPTPPLRDVLKDRLARFAAGEGKDLTVVEDEQHRGLGLYDRPLILLGVGSRIAQPFVRHALENCRIAALVDNHRAGTRMGGHVVQGEAILEEWAGREAVAVVCAFGSAQLHFAALLDRAGIPHLTLAQGLRRAGLLAVDEASDWLRNAHPRVTADLLARIEEAGFYRDPASLDTLHAVLLHRLTWNPRWLDPVRRPMVELCAPGSPLPVGEGAVIVDAGAYDGDTAAHFRAVTGGRYARMVCFEPDPANCAALRARVEGWPGVEVHEAGLWSSGGRLNFAADGGFGSHIAEEGGSSIVVVALDEMDGPPPTLVKMDIEGAEAPALLGMRRILRDHKPGMALSAYHRPEDLLELPRLLAGAREDYRFSLAHYGDALFDTVLYAA